MKEITELYDSIHMPAHLENQILNAAPAPRRRFRPATAIAAVLAVVLLLGLSPTVRAAVGEMLVVSFPGLDLTIYQESTDDSYSIVAIDTEASSFAEIRDDRLYFTGNNENIDITDQITEEEPFYYTYNQDEYEITLIVGYTGSIENFGTYEFIKENGDWFTGSGRNFLEMETEQAYPWVAIVWDTMDIPWPMPGAPVNENHVVTNIVLND